LIAWDLPLKNIVQELRRYSSGHVGVAPELADVVYSEPIHYWMVEGTLTMLADAVQGRVRRPLPWWSSIEANDLPQN